MPTAAEPPAVDGDVLGDPAWVDVPFATGFRQTNPDEGEPATERTEVRVLFTADTLYVGVVCYDRDPQAIIVTDSRRDSSLSNSDSFQLIFDTFLDKQNGFVFGTSPAGQEYDGQVINEGVGGSGWAAAAPAAAGAAGSTSTGTASGRSGRRSPTSAGASSSPSPSAPSAIRPEIRRRGASTSSAPSGAGTKPRTGRR